MVVGSLGVILSHLGLQTPNHHLSDWIRLDRLVTHQGVAGRRVRRVRRVHTWDEAKHPTARRM